MASDEVRAGARLLDEKAPGWYNRVDTSRLNLADPRDCVVGQVFSEPGKNWGGFLRGLEILFGPDFDDQNSGSVRHGFVPGNDDREGDWVNEIRYRRTRDLTHGAP